MSTFDTDYKYYNTLLKTTYKTGILALKKLMKEPDKMNTLVNSLGGMSLIFDQLTYDPLTYKDNNSKLRELILVSEWGETASMTYFKVLFGEDADIDTILNDADKYKLITDDVNKIIALSGSDILCAKLMAKHIGVDITLYNDCESLISIVDNINIICEGVNYVFLSKLGKLIKIIADSSNYRKLFTSSSNTPYQQIELYMKHTTSLYHLLNNRYTMINCLSYILYLDEYTNLIITLAYYPELIAIFFKYYTSSSGIGAIGYNMDFIKIFFRNYRALQEASFNLGNVNICTWFISQHVSWLNSNLIYADDKDGSDNERIKFILDDCPFISIAATDYNAHSNYTKGVNDSRFTPNGSANTVGLSYSERPMIVLFRTTAYVNNRFYMSGWGPIYNSTTAFPIGGESATESMNIYPLDETINGSNMLRFRKGHISRLLAPWQYSDINYKNNSCFCFYPIERLSLLSISSQTSYNSNTPGPLAVIYLDEDFGEYEEYLEGVE